MARRALYDGTATIILCFADASFELTHVTAICEERHRVYSIVVSDAELPGGASYVIVRFDGNELSGAITQQSANRLVFSQPSIRTPLKRTQAPITPPSIRVINTVAERGRVLPSLAGKLMPGC